MKRAQNAGTIHTYVLIIYSVLIVDRVLMTCVDVVMIMNVAE